MELADSVNAIKLLKGVDSYDEITTKQTIVLRIFQALDWNIFSPDEVFPEFAVENRKVDYCLRYGRKNLVFVEVKKPAEELGKHEEQLLDYSFKQGINMAVLTNGRTWWFYLPLLGEKWKDRRFYTIDIIEQETESISLRFEELLAKKNVQIGEALKGANRIHQDRKKAEAIRRTLPEAWNQMLGERNQKLIEIISDTTEIMCGFRPQSSDITSFLTDNNRKLLETYDEPEVVPAKQIPVQNNEFHVKQTSGRGSGPIVVRLDGKQFEESSIPKLYRKILKHIVDTGGVNKIEIPWGTGSKRYFIFKGDKPVHPNGRKFFQPVRYNDYYLEAHVERSQGVKYLGELCKRCGYKFEMIKI